MRVIAKVVITLMVGIVFRRKHETPIISEWLHIELRLIGLVVWERYGNSTNNFFMYQQNQSEIGQLQSINFSMFYRSKISAYYKRP